MPINYTINESDYNKLDDTNKSLYVKDGEGYNLEVTGYPEKSNDVNKLETALNKERESVNDYRKLGKTPAELAELLKKEEDMETEKLRNAGEFEKLLAKKEESYQKEKNELQAKLDRIANSERNATIKQTVLTELNKLGVNKAGLELLPQKLVDRIKIEGDISNRTMSVLDAAGDQMFVGGVKATIEDLVKSVIKEFPQLVNSKMKGGAGMQESGATGEVKTMSRSDWNILEPAAKAQTMKDGYQLTD